MSNRQSIFSLIKANRWNSIFFVFFKRIFVYMLIPFSLIFVITYMFFTKSIEKDFTKLIGNSLQKNCSIISRDLALCDSHYLDLAFSNQILNLLSADFTEKPPEYDKNLSYFNNTVTKAMHISSNIKNIILYNNLNRHIHSRNFSGGAELFENESWFKEYKAAENGNRNIFMFTSGNNSFFRCYKIFENKKFLGCLMFEIVPSIQSELAQESSSMLDGICLIDKDGTVFYNSAIDMNIINDEFIKESFSKDSMLMKQSNHFIYSQKSYNSDYITISISNYEHVSGVNTKFKLFFFGIVITLILLLLLISIYLSSYVYSSISKITVLLQDNPDYHAKDTNEIYYITQQILSVINDRNHIEEELTDKINQLKKLQITALNMQISPHFVFNTLNLVNAIIMSIIKKPNDAEKVVGILADSFYYSLKTENYIVNIEDEIYYTKKFIEIEHIKLEGKFDVNFDIEPGIEKYKALKFMLQPLVENSFSHGITKQNLRRGKITVKIYKNQGSLVCEIFDNGNKIDEKKLLELNHKLHYDWSTEDNNHIGLNNTNSRIKLIWGDSYGCSIFSDDNGTTATVKIPIMTD